MLSINIDISIVKDYVAPGQIDGTYGSYISATEHSEDDHALLQLLSSISTNIMKLKLP